MVALTVVANMGRRNKTSYFVSNCLYMYHVQVQLFFPFLLFFVVLWALTFCGGVATWLLVLVTFGTVGRERCLRGNVVAGKNQGRVCLPCYH